MANIYPIKEDLSEVPFAELKVYEALEKLGKNFYIFHSVQWLKKTKNGLLHGKKMIFDY